VDIVLDTLVNLYRFYSFIIFKDITKKRFSTKKITDIFSREYHFARTKINIISLKI